MELVYLLKSFEYTRSYIAIKLDRKSKTDLKAAPLTASDIISELGSMGILVRHNRVCVVMILVPLCRISLRKVDGPFNHHRARQHEHTEGNVMLWPQRLIVSTRTDTHLHN